ncbi:MAG: phospholipase D-like domain-containing protein [Candidatus Berkelbacteria bacterium]
MISHAQSFKQLLKRRDDAINAKKASESQSIDLYNENTFYNALTKDMLSAKKEVIIYSPFVSKFRTDFLKPTIEKLIDRNIDIFIFTRPIEEYDPTMQPQIKCALKRLEELGVCIFYPGRYIHQKVAIVDREVLWEGNLNILSHRASNEMMRRTANGESATQVMQYIGLNDQIATAYKLKYEKLYMGLVNTSRQNFKQKIKIFLLGMTIPIIVWLIVGLVNLRPVQIYTSLANSIIASLQH